MTRGTVALVGRPNVGKSTLFNRIVGGRRAIVHDRPGVTRDRHFGTGDWNGRAFWLVDTGGWTVDLEDPISRGIREQITQAVHDADVVVLVVDSPAGVHPADIEVAELLRRLDRRVIVAANKCDDLAHDYSFHAFHELGLGDPTPLSAATGKGSGDLLDRVAAALPEAVAEDAGATIRVALVGRPNVGKSSLSNRLLGADRSIVTSTPGTTRDAVDSPLRYHDTTLNFIDTAGLRRRPKVKDDIEFYSLVRTERAIERADVCVLVLDASEGPQAQDLRIADLVWRQGKGLIVAVNKWDLVENKTGQTAEEGRQELIDRVPLFRHVPFTFVSALTGQRVRKLLEAILEVSEARERRVGTAEVNQVLERLIHRNQPPQAVGKEVKLLYGSQVGTRPPVFAVVASRPEAIPESYQRYLVNGFYEAWGFVGSPIRLKLRGRRTRR